MTIRSAFHSVAAWTTKSQMRPFRLMLVALSQRVLSGAPGSVEAYLNFLRSGGSKFPLETLRAAGVDMTAAAPIESALHLFERRLDELEALLL